MPNTEVGDWPSRLNEQVLLSLLGSRSSGTNVGGPKRKPGGKNIRIYTTDSAPKKIRDDETVDDLGRDLKVPVDALGQRINDPGFWDHFKNEIKILICGKNRRYADIRKQLKGIGVGAEAGIAMSLATVLGATFGVPARLLINFVVLALIVIARLGINAFCASTAWDIPIVGNRKR